MKTTLKINDQEIELEISKDNFERLQQAMGSLVDIKEEQPQKGDAYWWISVNGIIWRYIWDGGPFDAAAFNTANVFRTEEDAQRELLRREARGGIRWVPKMGEEYWRIGYSGRPISIEWDYDLVDSEGWHLGNVHRTKEEAEEWWNKYGKAFEVNG